MKKVVSLLLIITLIGLMAACCPHCFKPKDKNQPVSEEPANDNLEE